MASGEERLKILTLISEGKITAEEGIRLLETLSPVPPKAPAPPSGPAVPPSGRSGPRFLRVRVTDTNSGKTRVNVRLPVGVIQAGVKMGARFAPEVDGLDAGKLLELINDGMTGQVVDVYDEEDGEHVEVFLE